MPRVTPVQPEAMSDEQRALYEAILGGKRGPGMRGEDGALIGPFNAMLLNPHVGDRVQRLGEALRFDISLSRNVIEVATLVVGSHWRRNSSGGRTSGWPNRLACRKRSSRRSSAATAPISATMTKAAAYDAASELYRTQRLTDATYANAVQRFGEAGVFELVALVGYYSLVSLLLNGFDVPLPAGQTPPFSD